MAQAVDDERSEEWVISRLDPPYFDYYWPFIERDMDLVPETWQGHITKEELYEGVQQRVFQVWATGPKKEICLVLFTRIVEYAGARRLVLNFAFGNDIDEAIPLFDATLTKFAAVQDCTRLEVVSTREGWMRKLKPLGFKVDRITVSRPVQSVRMN